MGYWLAAYTGDGSEEDSFAPSGSDALEHWSAIDLRADCTKNDGFAVMWGDGVLPADDSRVVLGADADAALSKTALDAVASKLNINLSPGIRSVRRLVRSLLLEHATPPGEPSRWNLLDASFIRPHSGARHYRIHLGEMYDEMPVLAGGSVATESFNEADSTTLGPDLTWTEVEQNSQVKSNQFCNVTTGSVCTARAETALSTSHMYTQIVLSTYTGTLAPARQVGPLARFAAAATTFYWARAALETGALRLLKVVAGSQTLLGSGATPGFALNDILKIVINGSTLESYKNGVLQESITDTAITANVRGGIRMLSTDTTSTAVDSFETGDYVLLATPAVVAGVGSIATPVVLATALPAFVGGTGTVQTSIDVDKPIPSLIGGTGTVQSAVEVAAALPSLVGGTGTVQSPTIVTNLSATATPSVVSGTGTVQSATLIDTLFPGLLTGTGTVQAAVEVATFFASVIAGTGTVQTSTEVDTSPSGFIAGAGTVQGYDGYLAKPHNVSVAGTPDALRFAINNELDVRIRFAADNWSSASNGPYLLSKYRVTGGLDTNSSWSLGMNGNKLTLETACGNGTDQRENTSNAGISAGNSDILWLRATYRAADGRVQFFTAPGGLRNPGVSDWTQLGTDITRTAFDLLHVSTADVVVGLDFPAGGDYFGSSIGGSPRGKVYAVEIRDGVDGTVVASPDWSRRASSTATITDAQGNVWTKNPYAWGAGDPAGFAGGDVQVLGSYPTEKAVALPAAVIGSGTVLAPAETEVAATVSGVGTAQSSVVVASGVPSVIAGVGTIQTILGLTVAFPGIVGGIGTVQSPTGIPAGVISVVSGLGSMDLATLSVAAILDVLAGVGTVESPTISTGLSTTVTPSEIAGIGLVQAAVAELVGSTTEISGVGLVEGVRSLISRTTVQVDGTGVVQGFTVVTAVPLGQISGIGSIATVFIETIGFPATIAALGTVESAAAHSLSMVSAIVGVGSIDVILIEIAAKPTALLGVGSVDTPGVTTSNALLVTVLIGVGSIESGVVLSPILDTPRVPIKWVLGIGEVETPVSVFDAPLLAIEGTGYFGFTTIFVGVFIAIGITVTVAKRQAAISVSDRSMTISAFERQITTAPIDGLGINSE